MSELIVPRIGVTVKHVTVVQWLADDGSTVSTGQPVALIATDKVEMEIEASADGVLHHRAQPEEEHAVGAVIATIE